MDEAYWLVYEKAATAAFWVGIVLLPFALANLRRRDLLARMTLACFVFALVAFIAVIAHVEPPTLEDGESVSLRVAWQYWLKHEDISTLQVWGRSIDSWERIGKILEGIAGLAIVLDIIGAERLTRWGNKMASSDQADLVRRVLDALWLPCLFLGAIFAAVALFWADLPGAPAIDSLQSLVGALFAIPVAAVVFGLLFLFATGCVVMLVVGYAWVLGKPAAPTFIRSAAAICFVIGFHFDLLGS